ncbi:hypothetical protein P280DRAFT_519839 [Massarina eburnea CBS 473.64]|uniref:Uncharacterized protein n=1 Tax=Massarina eburnea CBS 473.64 TaxID=1395130 RepID=A0A6A6RTX2_9PLEO|nr:hypothetical protein P280DRAFT_519839 [Massarina eburnea CBS 473.64]
MGMLDMNVSFLNFRTQKLEGESGESYELQDFKKAGEGNEETRTRENGEMRTRENGQTKTQENGETKTRENGETKTRENGETRTKGVDKALLNDGGKDIESGKSDESGPSNVPMGKGQHQ